MNKQEVKKSIQDGFSELSPDIFVSILEAAEKENLIQWKIESDKSEESTDNYNPKSIEINRKDSGNNALWKYTKYALSACACLALICICIVGILRKDQKEMLLLLNINPSLRIVMNDSCQVKDVQGLNEDGIDVVQKLKWNKKATVFEVLDLLLENTADTSYLNEDSGILITICVSNPEIYEELEKKIEVSIDRNLDEIELSDVIVAFHQGKEDLKEDGRKYLETKLIDEYGADMSQIQKMSVAELIRYGREYTMDLKLSPRSDRQWKEAAKRNEEIWNWRNEIENEIEIISETEEADVNSENKDVQDMQTEEKETVQDNKGAEKTENADSAEASALSQDSPASSESTDSSSDPNNTNQDQTVSNTENNRENEQEKKKKKDKKKKDKKKKNKKKKDKKIKEKNKKRKKNNNQNGKKEENDKKKSKIKKKDSKKKKKDRQEKIKTNKEKSTQNNNSKDDNKINGADKKREREKDKQ